MPKRLKDYQIDSDQVEEIRNKKKPRKFKDNEDYNKNKKRKNDQTIIKVLFESPISKEKRTFIKWNYCRSIKKD